jgi:hypothetical protein
MVDDDRAFASLGMNPHLDFNPKLDHLHAENTQLTSRQPTKPYNADPRIRSLPRKET